MEQALSHLEAQRATLGDAVVDAAVATIQERLASLRADATTEERRHVTILFADLAGFTPMCEAMDPEEVGEIQAAFFKACRQVIERHKGVVEKFIGDAVVAVFGVPVGAETDPSNAVAAGLELQSRVRELNEAWGWPADGLSDAGVTGSAKRRGSMTAPLRLRVGVHTGLVAVTFPSGRADGFAVAGDTVNTASRVQSAAPPGGVLITHATYRHVHGSFDVQPVEPLSLKGKSEPLRTYLVCGPRVVTCRRAEPWDGDIQTPMVGRDHELLRLQEAYTQTVTESRARSILVIGEAGIGKSRLIFEFERWLRSQTSPAPCMRSRAVPELRTTPYGLIREMFRSHFDIRESDSVAEVRRKFESGVASYLHTEQAQVAGHVLGFDFSSAPGVRKLAQSPTLAQNALAHLWAYFQGASRATPLVILVEDLHWADSPSLEFIGRLGRQSGPHRILLIATTRPGLLERAPSWKDPDSGFLQLPLSPLTPAQSQTLITDILLNVEHLPASLCARIVEHADGNPFFLEETIKMLIDDGVIVRGVRTWAVSEERLGQLRVPSTLTGVLQARLDGLPPSERRLLQRAAVVGRHFWDGAIHAMQEAEDTRIDVEECLREAHRKGLVFPRRPSRFRDSCEYVFKHAVLREVVYESVLLRSRRVYHRQTARWLEQQAGERTREFAALIADHYEKAAEAEDAARWLERAADAAVRSADYRQAVADAERALTLLARVPDGEAQSTRGALLVTLGEAHAKMSAFADARRYLEEALRVVGDDRELAARALVILSRATCLCGNIPEARCLGERGLALARETGYAPTIRNALIAIGYVLFFQGDYERAAECGKECLDLAERDQDEYDMARPHTVLGNAAMSVGDCEAARVHYEEGIRLADAVGAPYESATCRANLGNVYLARGDYAAALGCYRADYDFARTVGDRWGAAVDMANIGHAHERLGDTVTATRCYDESFREAMEVDAVWVALSALAGKAGIIAAAGEPIRAAKLLGLALRHPLSNAEVARDAEKALTLLRAQLSPEVLEEAMQRGARRDLQAMA